MHRCLKVLGALEVPQRAQVEPTLHSDLQPQRRYLAVKQHNSDAGNHTPAITHSDLGTHESAVHGRPAAKRHNDLAATLRDYVRGISNRNILKNWDYVSRCTARNTGPLTPHHADRDSQIKSGGGYTPSLAVDTRDPVEDNVKLCLCVHTHRSSDVSQNSDDRARCADSRNPKV